MDDFEDYIIEIDSECLYQDFDDVDFYGDKAIEETKDSIADNIDFE